MGAIDISPLRDRSFWRASFLEFLGTTIFLFVVTSVLVPNPADVVKVSFAIGLSIGVLAHIFGPITGGHFNPAVTLGAIIIEGCSVLKGLVYMVAQIVGGIAGSALTFALHPSTTRNRLDGLRISLQDYTEVQGFFVEMILTSLLVLTFLASTSNDNKRKNFGFANGLAVGLSITVAHLVGMPVTGACINPARAFGPSLIVNSFQAYHWIYWVAPMCGGLVAGLVYRFAVKPEMSREDEDSETAPLLTSYNESRLE